MKKVLPKTNIEKEFIIVDDYDRVFCGLKGGYPIFTEDWQLAKPLKNESQFNSVKRGTTNKLQILWI